MPGANAAAHSFVAGLSSLKAADLQRLAFLTGLSLSGTKPVLIQRLTDAIQATSLARDSTAKGSKRSSGATATRHGAAAKRPTSILSIDMGIRNLAFAHLVIPARKQTGELSKQGTTELVLNAWSRIAVSSLPSASGAELSDKLPLAFLPEKKLPGSNDINKRGKRPKHSSTVSASLPENGPGNSVDSTTDTAIEKESFAPNLYASHAYNLITSLLNTYKPTHILIERQRFRSGGGSAVQEWTLRVGMFEAMLYAVLHTLKQEARGMDVNIEAHPVDPQRVVRYWLGRDSAQVKAKDCAKAKKKKAYTSREGKKVKMALVQEWLMSAKASDPLKAVSGNWSMFLRVDSQKSVSAVVDAYLAKIGKGKRNAGIADVGKLDDLADCLLQGVAWLEWRAMREQIAHGGFEDVLATGKAP